MWKISRNRASILMVVFAGLYMVATSALARSPVQEAPAGGPVTLDQTKMSVYRALAQLTFQSFKKGDSAVVATLARILERTWDVEQGELRKNPDVWGQIDSAMDGFIKPLMGYAKNAPDPSSVEMAYKTFLEKLKQAD
jgi:hypothetical protein